MPEVAGGWPEQGSQYLPGAPMDPVQQQYQQAQYQQAYPQQQYGETPQYPPAQQQQYQQAPPGAYPEQAVQQQAMFAQDEQSSVPSEFDHLFRDSVPADRRSISRQAVVGGAPPAAGFAQAAQAAQAGPMQPQPQPQATAMYTPQDQIPAGYPQQGQQPPFGPGGEYEPMPQRPGRGRAPFVIGGVVVVVAAVGLYLGLSSGSGAPVGAPTTVASPTASAVSKLTAQQQADALYQLVSQAKTLRSEVNGGYSALLACDIPTAQSEIGSAVSGRQAALASLAKMDVGKIDGGADVVDALKTAWTDSYTSDQDYAKAVADFPDGANCSKSAVQHDPNLQAAGAGSSESSRAKSAAAKLWNQTMKQYGEPEISSSQL